MRQGRIVWTSKAMTQREFERRVKGIVDQPRKRKRERREPSNPGRAGAVLKAFLAAACVAALLVLTANGSRYFAFHGSVSSKPVQVTEEQAIARASIVPAPIAATAHHVAHRLHHRRAAAEETSARHALAAGAHRRPVGAVASAAHSGAAAAAAQSGDSSIDEQTQWLRSRIRSAFAPIIGDDAAESTANTVLLHLPMVAGAGVFVVVMLLCLGVAMAMPSRPQQRQSVQV